MSLAKIIKEMQEAQRPKSHRAYDRLRDAALHGEELNLSDHDLVLAISVALWNREPITAQYGLSELEIRTAADAVAMAERRAA